MAAPASVRPQTAHGRVALLCNCRMSLVRHSTGEVVTVKARAWDCPSCGLDKQRTLAAMCQAADPAWLLTLTFTQPHAVHGATGEDLTPARHASCDRASHVYEYVDKRGRSSLRWRLLSTCAHCCRYVSRALALWRKRMRRRWPAFDYLWAREDHPRSGAVHVHLALVGLPRVLTRADRGFIKDAWNGCGGGFSDLSKRSADSGNRLGWYLGKYLAKRHDQRMSKGYRRWSRTQRFAPGIVMNPYRAQREDDPSQLPQLEPPVIDGWLHPLTDRLAAARVWLDPPP